MYAEQILKKIQELHEIERAERPVNPDADQAPITYSSAGKCDREIGFMLLHEGEGEPFDIAGVAVTEMGSMIHEKWQSAAALIWPDMQFEVSTSIKGIARGRADGWDPTTKTVWELKSMGGFKFKKVCGINGYRRTGEGGPQRSWLIQTGLNAFALGADTLVITATTTEAISKGAAKVLGLEEHERVSKEWVIPYSQIADEIEAEIENWRTILSLTTDGILPAPMFVKDSGEVVQLNPRGGNGDAGWVCDYCPHHQLCIESMSAQ